MGDNRRFWKALISVDWGAVLNFGSLIRPNECSHYILSVRVFVIKWVMHNLRRQPSICSSNVLAAEYTKFYWWLDLKFPNFLFHFSHFEKEAPGTSLYSRSHFIHTCAFCSEDGGPMCGKHWLADDPPVNNAYKCTFDRSVPVNSQCEIIILLISFDCDIYFGLYRPILFVERGCKSKIFIMTVDLNIGIHEAVRGELEFLSFFISIRFGGALNISNHIKCLYRTVLDSTRKYIRSSQSFWWCADK